jgi:hypothetical protein
VHVIVMQNGQFADAHDATSVIKRIITDKPASFTL